MSKQDTRALVFSLVLRAATVLGVCNHTFDRARKQFVYSRGAFFYRMTVHVAAFMVMVVNFKKVLRDVKAVVHEKNFAMQLGFLCTSVNLIIMMLALISEYRNHGRITDSLNELLKIRIEDSVNAEGLATIRGHAWKLFLLKTLSTLLIVSTLISSSINFNTSAALVILYLTSMIVLTLMLLAFQNQFSVAMIYGAYLFKALNLRLSQVVEEVNNSLYPSRRKVLRLREALHEVGCVHATLLKLVIGIKDIYQFDILVMLAGALLYQVCAVFYFFLVGRGLLRSMSGHMLLSQIINTCLCGIDLLLGMHICVECVAACDAAGGILKGLTTFFVIGSPLERDIDILSFQLAREKLHLSILGLFHLNDNTAPAFFTQIVLYLILLTQITYFELH